MPAPFTASITPQRVLLYGLASSASALGVVLRAFRECSNFYSATIFLGRSNGCILVLLNFLFFLSLVFGRFLQHIFFGPLRPIEVERMYERSWYSLVGTLLAISIFRDDFDVSFVLLFGILLFLKAFHWLSADRVEFMEQSPSVSRLFHVRLCSILSTLLFVDLFLVAFAVEILFIKKARVGIMILFASEFMILTASLCSTIAKYGINCADLRHEEPWEAKSMWIFYVDLAHDALRLVTHAFFFVLLSRWYGIPLNLIHDLYVTGSSCATKVRDLVRYRKATKNMDTKYPDANSADLANTDGTCIICREDMVAQNQPDAAQAGHPAAASSNHGLNVTPKKLPCGHIFHFHCLRSWLARQQSCPTCRRTVLEEDNDGTAQRPAPPTAAAPAAPQPGAVPQAPPQTQPGSGTSSAPAPAAAAGPSAAPTPPTTAAERTFDQRLQGFIQRLQSDLHRVRQEGDLSARAARNRAFSPSSRHRTPHSGSATRSGYSTPISSTRTFAQSQQAGSSSGGGYLPTSLSSAAVAGGEYGSASQSAGGGLWMPPPPSSLYMRGRAPIRSEVSDKGKGKASDSSEAPSEHITAEHGSADPDDPREAIRLATLKRFAHLVPTDDTPSTSTSPSTGETHTPSPLESTPSQPVLIPLFEPSSIPDFTQRHVPNLPFPLISTAPLPAPLDPNASLEAQKLALQHQILLLAQLQHRIDGVIDHITALLDVVHPPQQPQQQTSSTQNQPFHD